LLSSRGCSYHVDGDGDGGFDGGEGVEGLEMVVKSDAAYTDDVEERELGAAQKSFLLVSCHTASTNRDRSVISIAIVQLFMSVKAVCR